MTGPGRPVARSPHPWARGPRPGGLCRQLGNRRGCSGSRWGSCCGSRNAGSALYCSTSRPATPGVQGLAKPPGQPAGTADGWPERRRASSSPQVLQTAVGQARLRAGAFLVAKGGGETGRWPKRPARIPGRRLPALRGPASLKRESSRDHGLHGRSLPASRGAGLIADRSGWAKKKGRPEGRPERVERAVAQKSTRRARTPVAALFSGPIFPTEIYLLRYSPMSQVFGPNGWP